MRLIQGISNKLSKIFGKSDSFGDTGKGLTDSSIFPWMTKYLRVSYERAELHRDMNRMDKDDEIVKFALDTIASRSLGLEDTTLDAFTVDIQSEDQKDGQKASDAVINEARWEIKQLNKRLNMQNEVWQIVRRFVKYGDEFRELLIDAGTLDITGLKQLPEQTMFPNIDDMGNRVPGYTQVIEGVSVDTKSVSFSEWEILQLSFGEIDGYKGTPLLDCARKNWKRLNLAEDATALARLVRAFMKIIHKVPTSSNWNHIQQQQAIDDYKKKMTKLNVFTQSPNSYEAQDWPQTVATDFYTPDDGSGRGGIEMLDPENAQLQNIRDIEHFVDRLITATHIPKRYFPFEGSTPKLSEGGGNAEDKNFACLLVLCQNILKQGLAQLYDRQLAMKGIDPSQIRYVFRMADINTVDQLRMAQTELALTKSMELLIGKFPELRTKAEVILREYTRMSDAALVELSSVDLTVTPESEKPAGNNIDSRVQLPGTGVGPEVRSKV